MNKKALIGKLVILVLAVLLIVGTFIYFRGGKFSFGTEKVQVDVSYKSDKNSDSPEEIIASPDENRENIIEIPQNNETNSTSGSRNEIILDNNKSYNLTNISN